MSRYQPITPIIGRYLWWYKLTAHGRALVGIGVVTAFLGGASLDVPTYIFLCMFFVLGLLAVVVNLAGTPRIALHGALPRRAATGEALTVLARAENVGRWSARDVGADIVRLPRELRRIRDAETVAHLGPGDRAGVRIELMPEKRGVYRLPALRGFSTFPFNITRSGRGYVPGETLVVLPKYEFLESFEVPTARRYQPGGVAMSSDVGESPEYLGNREFRPGDKIKHIEHRAWARTGELAVREYREEFYTRVALIMDTEARARFWNRRSAERRLEAAVSLSASVAEALSRGEYLIDLFAAGPELHIFRAGRHTAHFENVLDILAGIGPCPHDPFVEITSTLAEEIGRTSTVVCVFVHWDDSRRALLELAIEHGCAVKVLIVGGAGQAEVDSLPPEYHARVCDVEAIESEELGAL